MANAFSEVLDALYAEQASAREVDDYATSFAYDTAIDRWDWLMKGVPWEEGLEKYVTAMDLLVIQVPEMTEVWETAKLYALTVQ